MLDPSKSLAQLGGDIGWDGPTEDGYKSGLVTRLEGLYRKPLDEFSPGELRVMIAQDIALQYLVPIALDFLAGDPLITGDYQRGDLLTAVLDCGRSWPYGTFWSDNPELRERLETLITGLPGAPGVVVAASQRFAANRLTSAAHDQPTAGG